MRRSRHVNVVVKLSLGALLFHLLAAHLVL